MLKIALYERVSTPEMQTTGKDVKGVVKNKCHCIVWSSAVMFSSDWGCDVSG